MKQNTLKVISKSFLSASLKGLVIFGVFGVALYTYALTYPATQPNPVSGIVGLYVGQTASSQAGNIGDYQTTNALCAPVDVNSHVCSPMEMVNTYNHNPAALAAETGVAWLNSGAPGNTSPTVNDCSGWTDNTLGVYGNVWSFDQNHSGILPCAVSLPVACCK